MSDFKQSNIDSNKVEIGYSLISEEHVPLDLVRYASLAENAGFSFATISDHYHPWLSIQGQSPFVWNVLGGISQSTKTLRIGTAVTCPSMRIHPAIIAQAAATSGAMLPNRFFLGVGTGENLNEHILGSIWPPHEIRSSMLQEAVDLIRMLWKGKNTSYYGDFFIVENARIYTLPEKPIPIIVAAEGPHMAKTAGEIGDGLVSTQADASFVKIFKSESGSENLPCYCQVTVCYDEDESKAKKLAHEYWPIVGIPGDLNRELPTPKLFEESATLVTEDQVAKEITCGADPSKHIEAIRKYLDAGYTKVSVHNVGYNQEEFLKFYKERIIPQIMH